MHALRCGWCSSTTSAIQHATSVSFSAFWPWQVNCGSIPIVPIPDFSCCNRSPSTSARAALWQAGLFGIAHKLGRKCEQSISGASLCHDEDDPRTTRRGVIYPPNVDMPPSKGNPTMFYVVLHCKTKTMFVVYWTTRPDWSRRSTFFAYPFKERYQADQMVALLRDTQEYTLQ